MSESRSRLAEMNISALEVMSSIPLVANEICLKISQDGVRFLGKLTLNTETA